MPVMDGYELAAVGGVNQRIRELAPQTS